MFNFLIVMVVFIVLLFLVVPIIWFKRMSSAKKQIKEEAESKGWKNIKVKLGWWDFIVTYQDESGTDRKTHCTVWWKKITWMDEVKDGYIFPEASPIKLRWWKIIAIISAICFLVLSLRYEYEQLSWLFYKYSFANNGYAINFGRQYAVGVDKIIRGEEALKLIKEAKPDQPPPSEGKEYLILILKVKNISRNHISSWWFFVRDINTKSKSFFGDYNNKLDIECPPWNTIKEPETLDDIPFNGTRIISSVFEVPSEARVQKITIYADSDYDFESFTIPFSKSPFQGSNMGLISIFFSFFSIAISFSSKRIYLVGQKGFKKRNIFLPFILYFLLMMSVWFSSTDDFFRVILMLILFYISWSMIFLLSTTKVKE
jgi:hypothetical protein